MPTCFLPCRKPAQDVDKVLVLLLNDGRTSHSSVVIHTNARAFDSVARELQECIARRMPEVQLIHPLSCTCSMGLTLC